MMHPWVVSLPSLVSGEYAVTTTHVFTTTTFLLAKLITSFYNSALVQSTFICPFTCISGKEHLRWKLIGIMNIFLNRSGFRKPRSKHCVKQDGLKNTRFSRRARTETKKVKSSHTRHRVLGPELIPVYRQSACR